MIPEKNEGERARRLTYSQQQILGYIAGLTIPGGAVRCTKRDIANAVGCSEKTVDRAIMRLRKEGLVETLPCYSESGAQVGNAYRVARHPSAR